MHRYESGLFGGRTIVALFIILAGALLLAQNMGVDISINVWELWPLILIFVGFGHLIRPGSNRQPLNGIILIGIGLIFLGNNLDWFYLDFAQLWPIILILVGLMMIRSHSWKSEQDISDKDSIKLSLILGGGEHRFTSKQLSGAKITAVMGGGQIDLRESEMSGNELVLDVFTVMGGLEIRIPQHWEVNVQTLPILGGVENKTRFSKKMSENEFGSSASKQLTIKGTLIMGGLEIRN